MARKAKKILKKVKKLMVEAKSNKQLKKERKRAKQLAKLEERRLKSEIKAKLVPPFDKTNVIMSPHSTDDDFPIVATVEVFDEMPKAQQLEDAQEEIEVPEFDFARWDFLKEQGNHKVEVK